MLQITFWSLPSLAAIVLALIAYRDARQRDNVPGAMALKWLCASVVLWSFGQLLGTLTTDLDLKILASKLQYPGITLLPVCWFLFAITYARQWLSVGGVVLAALSVIPAISIALAWTNEWHHLLWADIQLNRIDGFAGLTIEYGPWFRVLTAYAYTLIPAGTLLLAYELSSSPRHRRALIAVILAPLAVAVPNLIHLFGFNPFKFFDPTPLGFAVGVIFLARGVLHSGLLEISPTLHREVIAQLADGVLIIDGDGRIMDANQAALELLEPDDDSVINQPLARYLSSVPVAELLDETTGSLEIAIGPRTYHVRASQLQTTPAQTTIVVFRDITERLEAEQELRQLKQAMEQLAYTDSLTGLPNRRAFIQRLQDECARVRRHHGELSVVLLDLDFFKNVNDTYGHGVGDRVLSHLATSIEASARACDMAARLGGEEFALLLPGSSLDSARQVAERLCRTVAGQRIPCGDDSVCSVTTSAGVAAVSTDSADLADWQDLLKRADLALYRAKDTGRNRVCV